MIHYLPDYVMPYTIHLLAHDPDKSAKLNIDFLISHQNICCGHLKELSFEHPQHLLKLMYKGIYTTYVYSIYSEDVSLSARLCDALHNSSVSP